LKGFWHIRTSKTTTKTIGCKVRCVFPETDTLEYKLEVKSCHDKRRAEYSLSRF
jgi:hypothetical protein